jgi:hypothetical protein
MKRISEIPDGFERLYSFRQIATMCGVGRNVVSRLFLGRHGVVNLGEKGRKATYRVPESLLVEVLKTHGYKFVKGEVTHA